MPSVKPLRLKRETYRSERSANSLNVAHVWVDSGLSHLDGLYSYRIPNEILSVIEIGSRLKVPFNARSCEAVVVELSTSEEPLGNLKIIESLLGEIPIANQAIVNFYSQMAKYWASDPFSIIKSGVPARVASVEKLIRRKGNLPKDSQKTKKIEKSYLMHSPYVSSYRELADLGINELKNGSVLLLLPDVKDVSRLEALLRLNELNWPVIRLDSSLSRTDRYTNYLLACSSERCLVIGTRSALFVPMNNLASIIVGFEKSEQYFEQKHPYWNVRDSVEIRSEIESANLIFTGYVPSVELAFQIEQRRIKFVAQKHSLQTMAFPQERGELLPGRIISEIRKSLNEGPVLFLAPRKGYANAVLCAKCKNIALCGCGARLVLNNQNANPICSMCTIESVNWKCTFCSGTIKYAAARGIERFQEEIGKAFPNVIIQLSNSPNILENISPKTKIVLATIGSIPGSVQDYSSVVILEGQRFLASGSSSYEEMAYESFFEASSRMRKGGKLLIVLDSFHPVVASLSRWNPRLLIKKILRENFDAFLPPYSKTATIRVAISEGVLLRNGIAKSIKDGRLPGATRVYFSENKSKGEARVVVVVPRDDRTTLANFIRELARKRAISKKDFISIALDPFVLM